MGATKDPAAPPAPPSPAAFYARALPLLALLLVFWFALGDVVLTRRDATPGAGTVTYGMRGLVSSTGADDGEVLLRNYDEAAHRIREHLGDAKATSPTDQKLRQQALDTEAAYRFLHARGWLAFTILAIAGLFLLAPATSRRLRIRACVSLQLIGTAMVVVGVVWFRWCFDSVHGALTYAKDGEYEFATAVTLLFVGLGADAAVAIGLYVLDRRGGASRRPQITTMTPATSSPSSKETPPTA